MIRLIDEVVLFKAKPAREIAGGVTQRQLNHWIDTAIIYPFGQYEPKPKKRRAKPRGVLEERELRKPTRKRDYLFDLRNLLQLRLVREFRTRGISLKKIREAIECVQESGDRWENWLIHVGGSEIWKLRWPGQLEVATGPGVGQLGLTAILLPLVRHETRALVAANLHRRFSPAEYKELGDVVVLRRPGLA